MADASLKAVRSPRGRSKRVTPDLVAAAESGDRLAELKAMRVQLAEVLSSGEVAPRDLAALTKRLADMGREVQELEEQVAADVDARAKAAATADKRFRLEAI